jgi:hypothetical protein
MAVVTATDLRKANVHTFCIGCDEYKRVVAEHPRCRGAYLCADCAPPKENI